MRWRLGQGLIEVHRGMSLWHLFFVIQGCRVCLSEFFPKDGVEKWGSIIVNPHCDALDQNLKVKLHMIIHNTTPNNHMLATHINIYSLLTNICILLYLTHPLARKTWWLILSIYQSVHKRWIFFKEDPY